MFFPAPLCLEAVFRAQDAIETDQAITDINRRLGTRVDKIPLLHTYSAALDRDADTLEGFPVFEIGADAKRYLSLDDFDGVDFRWVIGVWNDPVIGPVPTFFMCSKYQTRERVVALVWSHLKCSDSTWSEQASRFKALGRQRITDKSQQRGAEGGYQLISEIGIIFQRSSGGLDMRMKGFLTVSKLWDTLESSVMHNAVSNSFAKTAQKWPYPPEFEPGIYENSGASGVFECWY